MEYWVADEAVEQVVDLRTFASALDFSIAHPVICKELTCSCLPFIMVLAQKVTEGGVGGGMAW